MGRKVPEAIEKRFMNFFLAHSARNILQMTHCHWGLNLELISSIDYIN